MFARLLSIPFVLLALGTLYLTWEVDESYSLWIIPPVIITALLYVFAPQINWWWYQRTPPKIDPMVKTLLGKYLPFYDNLSPEDKQKFDHRLGLYQLSVDYQNKSSDGVPEDAQGLIAACAVWLTFNREEFLFPKFENVVVYNHAFPSPQQQDLHASEIFEEDGVLVFSLEHFMPGFLETKNYYNIGLHEFAKVFVISYPDETYPTFGDDFWNRIGQINGLKRDAFEKFMGLKNIETLPIGIVHHFVYPEQFANIFPEESAMLREIFG